MMSTTRAPSSSMPNGLDADLHTSLTLKTTSFVGAFPFAAFFSFLSAFLSFFSGWACSFCLSAFASSFFAFLSLSFLSFLSFLPFLSFLCFFSLRSSTSSESPSTGSFASAVGRMGSAGPSSKRSRLERSVGSACSAPDSSPSFASSYSSRPRFLCFLSFFLPFLSFFLSFLPLLPRLPVPPWSWSTSCSESECCSSPASPSPRSWSNAASTASARMGASLEALPLASFLPLSLPPAMWSFQVCSRFLPSCISEPVCISSKAWSSISSSLPRACWLSDSFWACTSLAFASFSASIFCTMRSISSRWRVRTPRCCWASSAMYWQ
mmetsp:Transcript_59034/g.164537  ORF Transcript_59034/g.164537 Transcript_59034/m.164537 type:complete len:323 (-) Transcript_59034:2617-3585(-)